jgi:hypothetical protein
MKHRICEVHPAAGKPAWPFRASRNIDHAVEIATKLDAQISYHEAPIGI